MTLYVRLVSLVCVCVGGDVGDRCVPARVSWAEEGRRLLFRGGGSSGFCSYQKKMKSLWWVFVGSTELS